ncbi:MAG TPA: PA2169 family four-helix-bundle protein [Acidobacteriaceae bacterium]|nr:PA2169 family four-helix-bundle protein [Acidobacteriaceae bacterium]
MADTNDLVKTVIQVLNDGARGFADIGEHLKSPELKTFFLEEGHIRAQFARELQAAAGVSEDVGGTASGSIHRVWGDLKANLGGGDHTLLETAEQGEDAAKKAYKEALEDTGLDSNVRSVLQRQQPHIQVSHDKVKAYRDNYTA